MAYGAAGIAHQTPPYNYDNVDQEVKHAVLYWNGSAWVNAPLIRAVTVVQPTTSTETEVIPSPGLNTILAANSSRKSGRIRNGTNRSLKIKEGANASEYSFTEEVPPGETYNIEFPAYTGLFSGYFDTAAYGSVFVTERT